jgi:hypothetical protein
MRPMYLALLLAPLLGCKNDLASEEQVQTALDAFLPTLEKLVEAGLSSKDDDSPGANITPIEVDGAETGLVTLTGSVSQSSGENTQMNLEATFEDYSDDALITWDAGDTPLALSMGVQNTPDDNQMASTLTGPVVLTGEVAGDGTFALNLASDLVDDDAAPDHLCTRVTGTVTVGQGSLEVDVTVPVDATEEQLAGCL